MKRFIAGIKKDTTITATFPLSILEECTKCKSCGHVEQFTLNEKVTESSILGLCAFIASEMDVDVAQEGKTITPMDGERLLTINIDKDKEEFTLQSNFKDKEAIEISIVPDITGAIAGVLKSLKEQ